MKKNIAVVIRQPPFNTARNKEGLRMCVGATLKDNIVTVIFLGPGVVSAGKTRPELIGALDVEKEFEAFKILKMRLVAQSDAVEQYNVQLRDSILMAQMDEIARILADCDVVISW
ncbi:MAG: DsrE family protein [ANME-2 cluster archaeon]|nr:DsrE family protein [ANME-2 cluster archaeon]